MAIFTAIASAIFGAGTFLAGALSFGLSLAASVGLSYLAKAIAGKNTAPSSTQGSFGVQGKIAGGGDVPRSFQLGYSVTAGSLVWANTWGTDPNGGDKEVTQNAYLTQVIAISDMPVGGLGGVWVNGELVTLGVSPHPNLGYPVTEYFKGDEDHAARDHLWIKFYDGTQTEADPWLPSIGTADRPYEVERVGIGVAYAIVTSLVDDTLFTGIPTLKFEVPGIRLYDPSKDDTAGGSGDHRYSDPTTWGGDGDNLPAVQAYNLLRGIKFNGQWLYGLQNITPNRIPTSNWIAQIEKCRATIEGASGPEPTYRSGMQVSVNNQLADAVEALLTACQGKVSEIGGYYKIHVGAPDSPTFFFTDDDILSTEEQTFTPFFGLSDTINGITASYPSPAQAWNTTVAPPLYNTDFETEDGGRRLLSNVALDAVPYDEQVQRLMSSALEEARRARRHTHVMPPEFWIVEPGDVGSWTSARNGYVDKLFRVDGATDKANLDAVLDLTEVDPSDYDWDTGTDYIPPVTGPTVIVRPPPQAIVDWFAEATIIKDANGVDRRPAILLSWDGDQPDVSGVQFEVRITSDDTVVLRGRTDNVAAGAIIISANLLPNQHYEVRGRYIPASPRDTLWSDWLPVDTPNVLFSILDFEQGLADQVTNQFQDATDQIDKIVRQVASVAAELDAAHELEDTEIKSNIAVARGQLSASIEQVQQVAVSTQAALASFTTTVTAALGVQSASITQNATAIATIDGHLAGSYSVTVNVSGYASGFKSLNDGSTSAFIISADVLQFGWPGVAGGAAVPVFQIANVAGSAKLTFRGDMLADGAITASKISVGSLSAIKADLGTVTAGVIQSQNGLMLIDANNARIVIYRP